MKRIVPVLLVIVAGVALAWYAATRLHDSADEPHVVDGVAYGFDDRRLLLTISRTDPEGRSHDHSLELWLAMPAFGDVFKQGPMTYGFRGSCRPMAPGECMRALTLDRCA